MTTLYLYKGISPNLDKTLHYYYTSKSNFLSLLNNTSNNYLLKSIELDNYRINTNIVKLKIDETLNELNYEQVTYMAVHDNVTNYIRFYHVNSAIIQSGFVIYDVTSDIWANNIDHATFKNMLVKRTNKFIGSGGFYDNISIFKGNFVEESYLRTTSRNLQPALDSSRVSIVFLLQYNISQQTFGNDKISCTRLFITRDIHTMAEEIRPLLSANEKNKLSDLFIATNLVSQITGIGSDETPNDAQVIRAWLVDNEYIYSEYKENGLGENRMVSSASGGGISWPAYVLNPQHIEVEHTFSNPRHYCQYYVGNYQNGMPITQFKDSSSNEMKFYLNYIVDDNEIKIFAQQGNHTQDITNMYEISLNINASQQTMLRKLADVTKTTTGFISNIPASLQSGFSKGGLPMALLETTFDVANEVLSMIPQTPSIMSARGGGDGLFTFSLIPNIQHDDNLDADVEVDRFYVRTPYIITRYASAFESEDTTAIRYGINYNKYTTLTSLFNAPFVHGYAVDMFVTAIVTVEGVNVQAKDVIENAFGKGLFLVNI